MPLTSRERTIAAPVEALWAVIADPYHLPRWWPQVERVEGVDEHGFTQVLRSKRGRAIRADYAIESPDPPNGVRWRQELENTPFERILRSAAIVIRLEPDGDGTRVQLSLDQALSGASMFGGVMVRRAARAKLDEALDGLERTQA